MNNKFCIIVLGSESSGTKILTQLLLDQPDLNLFGDATHQQRLDNFTYLPSKVYAGKNLIIRRSIPHAGEFVRVDDLTNMMLDYGYIPKIIGIIRSEPFVLESKIKNDHVLDYIDALDSHRLGLEYLVKALTNASTKGVYTRLITYESLVWETIPLLASIMRDILHTESQVHLDEKIINGNKKYW